MQAKLLEAVKQLNRALTLVLQAIDEQPDAVQPVTETPLRQFLTAHCESAPGERLLFKDFFAAFRAWLPAEEREEWSRQRVSRELTEYKKKTGNHNKLYVLDCRLKP